MALTRVTNNGLDPNDEFSFNGLNVTGVVTATSGVGTIILDPAGNMLKLGNATMHRDSTTGDTIIMNNDGAYNPLRASKYLINTNTVIDSSRNINAGVLTATTLYGDGSNLSGIDATQIQTGNTSVQTVDTGSDGHVKINTEGTERVRITSSGDVGIGTDNPAQKLQVQDGHIDVTNGSGHSYSFSYGKFTAERSAAQTTFEVFQGGYTGNTETSKIYADGKAYFLNNVGIGTDNPGHKLDVAGPVRAKSGNSGFLFQEYNNGATLWLDGADGDFAGGDYFGIHANNSSQLTMGYAGAESFKMDSSGRVVNPSQPIFSGRNMSGSGTAVGSVNPLLWTTVNINTGSHFNNTTGVFTAPVNGNYLFLSKIGRRATANNWVGHYMLRNGSTYVQQWTRPGATPAVSAETYIANNLSIIVPLSANDNVVVGWYTGYSAPTTGTNENHLSIYLVG